ncbi:hypothetical protein ACTFIY_002421 [Dictyostelium cf. discoideum]
MNIRNSLVLIISTILLLSMISGSFSLDPTCVGAPDGQVYLFNSWDFKGERYVYNVSQGYLSLSDGFRGNVQSFISGADVCFVKWYPREQYQITAGESHRNYAALTNFGQRMDAIIPGNCSNIVCSPK